MAIVKPNTSKSRKFKKQLQTQKQELEQYMRQPGFKGQLPIGQEEAEKRKSYIEEALAEKA